MMRILVTGLAGFTGRYVKTALESAGHQVIGLKSNLTDAPSLTAELAELKLDAVIHLAAIAFVGHGDANAIYQVNLLGTRNLLQALAQSANKLQHVLIASSANVYGNSSEGMLNEQTTANPANDYAVSKYAMELAAGLWAEKLPITLVRPFNYTGVGQDSKFLIPKIVEHFKAKKAVIELGNLEVWREFNDVRFIADSYAKLIEQAPAQSGLAMNICTGNAYSLHEAIGLCEKITGQSIEVQVNPAFVRANEVRILKGDNARLKNTVTTLVDYDLEQTLTWMLAA
ncbi:MAG: NAD-dependent epimerase/dehydratase family protein [Methyloprofundus sp.]|nr:NAD-dependent epimerase/dehydratase family protein [Methyloprofundus sp.]